MAHAKLLSENTKRLASLIDRLTGANGVYRTDIAGLALSRFSATNPPRHTIDCAVFGVVAQTVLLA